MCQKCLDAVKRWWPDLPKEQYGEMLWSVTCFPFGGAEQIESQIKDMAERSGCDLRAAMAIADDELTEAMAEFRKTEAAEAKVAEEKT